jgi:hypothetical protein
MSRVWPWLALTGFFGAACAGEEFTSAESSKSNTFAGSSGGGGAAGEQASGGTALGGKPGVSQGGAGGKSTASGGEPSVGGDPSSDGGASNGPIAGNSSTGGAVGTGGSGEAGGEGGASDPGSGCPLGKVGATCSNLPRACRDLPEGAPDGTYRIDPDAAGPIAAFDASCLFDAKGGWTLILNYVHKGGTNPALAPRKDGLPLLGSDELSVDESGSPQHWGHATSALLSALQPEALRFQGRTSQHERVIDFSTSDRDCLVYVMGGNTNCKALATNSSLLGAHSANLPRVATGFMSGKGDLALTEFPFYLGGQAHWAIKGETQRWEVDNTPVAGVLKYFYDTVHRVWMR